MGLYAEQRVAHTRLVQDHAHVGVMLQPEHHHCRQQQAPHSTRALAPVGRLSEGVTPAERQRHWCPLGEHEEYKHCLLVTKKGRHERRQVEHKDVKHTQHREAAEQHTPRDDEHRAVPDAAGAAEKKDQ